ncbi:uncharacterized protein LOC142831038 [Pelodiscus sinensis]|uniref:uncharacterized protein LOC142831038 n=1 Tax=Pelodiscus sinensis TaxID=13735 RepID=UPI003F6CB2C4
MEQSIAARLSCAQGHIRAATARLQASHEQARAELAAAQAELVALLREGWRKGPIGQLRAPGEQSVGDAGGVRRCAELQAGWEEVRADWDKLQAAWEEVLSDPAWAPADAAPTLLALPRILGTVAQLQARLAQSQASAAAAQLKALQAEGRARPTEAAAEPVLQAVYAQVAAAVHDILLLAMRDLARVEQAQRFPVLRRLTGAVHAQVEGALRGILAEAAQAVAAADRVELAEALCGQVEKAVRDVIVKVERDWGKPRGAPLEAAPGLRWSIQAVMGEVGAQPGWRGRGGCLEEDGSGGAKEGERRLAPASLVTRFLRLPETNQHTK